MKRQTLDLRGPRGSGFV